MSHSKLLFYFEALNFYLVCRKHSTEAAIRVYQGTVTDYNLHENIIIMFTMTLHAKIVITITLP